MKEVKILGLMSGSSCDGVDVALCKFWSEYDIIKYELKDSATFNFSDELRKQLLQAASLSNSDLKKLEIDFSRYLGKNIKSYLTKSQEVDYIASHGHTVLHDPDASYTVQIGAGSVIAAETSLPTICDFRSLDLAYQGQGAPIAPIADKFLFPSHEFYLNLGGIVNISAHVNSKILGYDIAPCNQILNALSKTVGLEFDEGGKLAASGEVNNELLTTLLANEYLSRPYPKSLDNSWVKKNYSDPILEYSDSVENKLCTSIEFMNQAIVNEIRKIGKQENVDLTNTKMFCTGGGAFNTFLMESLGRKCKAEGVEIVLPDPKIIEYKEAMLMGLMGYLRLTNQPNCLSSVTGASKDCSGGVIHYP